MIHVVGILRKTHAAAFVFPSIQIERHGKSPMCGCRRRVVAVWPKIVSTFSVITNDIEILMITHAEIEGLEDFRGYAPADDIDELLIVLVAADDVIAAFALGGRRTRELAKRTRIRDQPFLVLAFPEIHQFTAILPVEYVCNSQYRCFSVLSDGNRLEIAFERIPALGRAGIKNIVNGPFTFGPDGNPMIGPVPGMSNYWTAVGVMAGFCQAGGVGLCMAEWMIEGEPSIDVWAMDIARFGELVAAGFPTDCSESPTM